VTNGSPLDEFFYRSDEGAGELDAFVIHAEPEAATEPSEAPKEYLGFQLGDEEYAVELACIREIVKVPPLTEVPRAPAEVMGVMSLRGEVMPVFDLRKRLSLPKPRLGRGSSMRVVVVDSGEGPAGVLVDAVHQVLRLKPSAFEPPPPGLGSRLDSDYLVGIARQKDRMYVLLNLESVLGRRAGPERETT
jgi:purine-binding chemotaxis protein CheW